MTTRDAFAQTLVEEILRHSALKQTLRRQPLRNQSPRNHSPRNHSPKLQMMLKEDVDDGHKFQGVYSGDHHLLSDIPII